MLLRGLSTAFGEQKERERKEKVGGENQMQARAGFQALDAKSVRRQTTSPHNALAVQKGSWTTVREEKELGRARGAGTAENTAIGRIAVRGIGITVEKARTTWTSGPRP